MVCPLSVLTSWSTELAKWCPTLRVVRAHSADPGERDGLRKRLLGSPESYDVVVTTFEMIKNDKMKHTWCRIWWSALILDEGHVMKNPKSETSGAVRGLHARWTCVLTGTPLQNNLVELWAILNFLRPSHFPSPGPFEKAFGQ